MAGNYDINGERFKQFELIYDYIKFHIGLYIGTPPVFAILGESFEVHTEIVFQIGLAIMIGVYFISGISAGRFMSEWVNKRWQEGFLEKFDEVAYQKKRRRMHHGLYWVGLIVALIALSTELIIKAVR